MLEDIADDCRSLLTPCAVEMTMLVAIGASGPGAPTPVSIGDAHSVPARPEVLLRLALSLGAEQFVLVHNHRENAPPSAEDEAVTRRMVAAAAVVGIPLRAHLVVAPAGWYDCVEQGSPLHPWNVRQAA